MKCGLVPFIQSSPGIGKSSIVKQIAKEYNLKLIDLRLSTCDPTDLTGLPHFEEGRAVFSPFDIFPVSNDDIPKNKDGWLLFLN
jgi:MoxR-like ATPase